MCGVALAECTALVSRHGGQINTQTLSQARIMAAHNSTHTGKQIVLSQDEFPSQTEKSSSQNGHQVSNLGIL